MNYSAYTVDLPALVGIVPGTTHIDVVRPMASREMTIIEGTRKLYSMVSAIMAMYEMLHWNYKEIQNFTQAVTKGYSSPSEVLSTANRLLLNYIASADALLDHFGTMYKRQCRMKKIAATGFDDLRRNMENTDDDFEFFTHFRNYVIHVALPVGNLTITVSLSNDRTCSFTYRSEELSRDKRDRLSSCRMLAKYETIDLIQHLNRFHNIITTRIYNEVVRCFEDDLIEASQYLNTFAQEVANHGPQLRPHLLTYRNHDGVNYNWSFDILPIDMIAEVGLRMNHEKKDSEHE